MARHKIVLSGYVLVFALVFLLVLWSVNRTNEDGLVFVPGNPLHMLPRPSTELAFTVPDQDGMLDIFVAQIDGGHVRQTNLTRSPYHDTSPTWSPDGGQIAFASERDGTPAIYRMDVERAAETYLVDGTSPAWSPDGQIVGVWKRTLKRKGVDMRFEPFTAFGEREAQVVAAAHEYSDFLELPLALTSTSSSH